MTTLIADSGSTKTDWCLADAGRVVGRATTQGINPFHQTDEQIARILADEFDETFRRQVKGVGQVFYYGAGALPVTVPRLQRLLSAAFFDATPVHPDERMSLAERDQRGAACAASDAVENGPVVMVEGDLMGAARALFGVEEGIACILGTGSNSGLYDGERLVMNTPPLGYILGDEGSGAVMGRNFLGSLCKGLLSSALLDDYQRQTGLDIPAIIQRVYREPLANRFLAQTTRFIHQHLEKEEVAQFVVDNFRAFFRRNLVQYHRSDLPVRAIGSVAYYFREQLALAAEKEGFVVDKVEKSPMEGLVAYHAVRH